LDFGMAVNGLTGMTICLVSASLATKPARK
jgi:hypothetical protein